MMPGLSSSAPPAVLSSRSLRPAIPSADLRRRPLAISVTPGSRMSPDILYTCCHIPFSVGGAAGGAP